MIEKERVTQWSGNHKPHSTPAFLLEIEKERALSFCHKKGSKACIFRGVMLRFSIEN